jgi:hypothetical protein
MVIVVAFPVPLCIKMKMAWLTKLTYPTNPAIYLPSWTTTESKRKIAPLYLLITINDLNNHQPLLVIVTPPILQRELSTTAPKSDYHRDE